VGWSVEYGSVIAAAVLTQCGRIQKALRRKKGRERPRVTFRAAGRTKRGGRSRPFDALARVPVLQSWLRINLYGRGLQNRGRKTDQKTVRKTEFSTVFRYFNLFFTTYEVLSCEDLEAEEFALFYQMAGIFRQSRSAPLSHNLR